ncbi:MAG: 16S rRNA (adenine(1518)-N(6)/adenine(1519)-N(6))-dimethyltransferase RsmA [Chloroherpetonaceae bacterium]|nr:16S rRNA (adenine(1518)-N(6)/adenine(1519)-N(6))-dimethyltransferase RsmA [Chloroherpetonaceae bacterium]
MNKQGRFLEFEGKIHRPKKHLGQNFLEDKNILKKIADSVNLHSSESVIEIGPGKGALTEFLIQRTNRLKAIEVDNSLFEGLQKKFLNAEFILGDFLEIELESFYKGEKLVVVGNIPYYITTPIIFKLLENWRFIDRAVLMIQDEVAKRLKAEPETKDYGILAVQLQSFSEVSYLFQVGRKAFFPAPNVDSAVIELKFNPHPAIKKGEVDEKFYRNLIRNAFSMRRKTLLNNLKGKYDIDFFNESRMIDNKIDLSRRAETLTREEFILLSINLAKK